MACNHDKIRCTNNRFFCLGCGAELPNPYKVGKDTEEPEKPVETQKTGRKRRTRKESE